MIYFKVLLIKGLQIWSVFIDNLPIKPLNRTIYDNNQVHNAVNAQCSFHCVLFKFLHKNQLIFDPIIIYQFKILWIFKFFFIFGSKDCMGIKHVNVSPFLNGVYIPSDMDFWNKRLLPPFFTLLLLSLNTSESFLFLRPSSMDCQNFAGSWGRQQFRTIHYCVNGKFVGKWWPTKTRNIAPYEQRRFRSTSIITDIRKNYL